MFRPKSLFSFLSPPFGSLSLHPITANSAGSTFEYISQIQQLLSSHPLTSLVHFISIICLVSCLPLPLVVTFTSALVLCSHSCHEDALKRRVKAGHFSAQNPPTASNKITVRVLTAVHRTFLKWPLPILCPPPHPCSSHTSLLAVLDHTKYILPLAFVLTISGLCPQLRSPLGSFSPKAPMSLPHSIQSSA